MADSLGVTDGNKTFQYGNTAIQDSTFAQQVVENTSFRTECIPMRFNESQYLPWDSPSNIVSEEVESFSNKIKDFILAFSFLIGVPANVINMAVFFKQGLHDRVNLCLFMLAVSDNLFLISSFSLHVENIYLHIISEEIITAANEFMVNNNLIVIYSACFVSFILSAIVACERCYCVLRPLKYQTLLRTRTMAFIIVSVYLCVFSLYFIVAYRYWIGCVFDPVTGLVSMEIIGGGLYRTHKVLVDSLNSIVFGAILPGGTMVVVIAATTTTTVKLRQIVTWRTESSSSLSSKEVALTKMLIGNSVFFVICVTPNCVFRAACFFMPQMIAGGPYHNFYMTTLWALEGSTFINSSFNFFIYYAMGSRYRETFRTLFGKSASNKEETK